MWARTRTVSADKDLPAATELQNNNPVRRQSSARRRCSKLANEVHHSLKSRRRVHPQNPGFGASWIIPCVGHCALEIKTVAGLEPVFFSPEKNLQLALEHKKKLLADVSVG